VIGADTSFLVALALREHPAHNAAWELFEDEIRGRTASMAVAAQALSEFAHVVTDGRRFERPLPMAEALDICEQWWTSLECRPAVVDAEVGTLFLAWMRDHRLGRKQLLDTLLAATYRRAGAKRLATTNWRDFARFGAFELHPL
jgi:predicted nucleic acid-binding protein